MRPAPRRRLLGGGIGGRALRVRASPLPHRANPPRPGDEIVRTRFFCGQNRLAPRASTSSVGVEVLGEVTEDHLVQRLVADEVFAENRLALLRPGLSEDRGGSRRRVASLSARRSPGRVARSRRQRGARGGRSTRVRAPAGAGRPVRRRHPILPAARPSLGRGSPGGRKVGRSVGGRGDVARRGRRPLDRVDVERELFGGLPERPGRLFVDAGRSGWERIRGRGRFSTGRTRRRRRAPAPRARSRRRPREPAPAGRARMHRRRGPRRIGSAAWRAWARRRRR